MNKEQGQSYNLLAIILIVLGVTLASTLFRFQVFALTFLFLVSLVIGAVFYGIRQYLKRKEKGGIFHKKTGGKISNSLHACEEQIAINQSEIEAIKEDIKDLESHLIPGHDIHEDSRQESLRLIKAFKKQLALRQSKIDFYETCKQKLETLHYNHELALELERKQQKLRQLEEDNYEAVAKMESMKTEFEYDHTYISTIEKLSLKMLKSNSISDAEALNLELIQITKELKRL